MWFCLPRYQIHFVNDSPTSGRVHKVKWVSTVYSRCDFLLGFEWKSLLKLLYLQIKRANYRAHGSQTDYKPNGSVFKQIICWICSYTAQLTYLNWITLQFMEHRFRFSKANCYSRLMKDQWKTFQMKCWSWLIIGVYLLWIKLRDFAHFRNGRSMNSQWRFWKFLFDLWRSHYVKIFTYPGDLRTVEKLIDRALRMILWVRENEWNFQNRYFERHLLRPGAVISILKYGEFANIWAMAMFRKFWG